MVGSSLFISLYPIWPAKSYHHWSGFGLKLVESRGGGVKGVIGLS
ncbi:hypothetical protein HanRHA438_Chr03g0110721 [Helianthus annuus]|uniref:Uncharacterized protein n=1 Tax=Helianthus annuus TaxID=4232 RepID=A0A9K3JED5_HELAN|nr:hypothetical protein HanXRQr2_Chr03g0099701 [Helianthus annuus]KAJ0592267.1 hypothetical protein HanHA300_Chr03g0082981 [Helianthus annuus]KAJ0599770.1 hypothetical protein HanIR_Chr03g0108771 [Helianthus annuus]KAJ0607253.1 hypothetical protein HanHA89_Chr03g0094481 [Helianthus annuus]KAJ0767313.1 hypothetical protein HanLR1_Chr03g0087781 [Helianthus annuus]